MFVFVFVASMAFPVRHGGVRGGAHGLLGVVAVILPVVVAYVFLVELPVLRATRDRQATDALVRVLDRVTVDHRAAWAGLLDGVREEDVQVRVGDARAAAAEQRRAAHTNMIVTALSVLGGCCALALLLCGPGPHSLLHGQHLLELAVMTLAVEAALLLVCWSAYTPVDEGAIADSVAAAFRA